MHLIVCSLSQAPKFAKRHNATHHLALTDVGKQMYRPNVIPAHQFLNLQFEDNDDPTGVGAVTLTQIDAALRFTARVPDDGTLIINCHAGICRSTAMALAVLAQHHGLDDLDGLRRRLLTIRPEANPNLLVAVLADHILGGEGRLAQLALDISNAAFLEKHGMAITQRLPKVVFPAA